MSRELLEKIDQKSAQVQKPGHPRVSLADIETHIQSVRYVKAERALSDETLTPEELRHLSSMTLCFVMLRNGWIVIGSSAPADPENFNSDLGKEYAYEDAIRQAWRLHGFLLKEDLYRGNK